MHEITSNEKALVMYIINNICEKSRTYISDYKKPEYEKHSKNGKTTWKLSLIDENENYFKFTINGSTAEIERFPVLSKTTASKSILELNNKNLDMASAIVFHAVAWINNFRKIKQLNSDWDHLFGSNNNPVNENLNENIDDAPLQVTEVDNIRLLLNNLNKLISESTVLTTELIEESRKLNEEINTKLDSKPTNKTKKYIGKILLEFIKQAIFNSVFRSEITSIVIKAMDSVSEYSRELANPIIALLSEKS